ncbi:hypothetical protein CPB84DRAFT_1772955 [Gymnopilus junonius]|uniref:Uncharacterized protein n=1 Tax=Gymnopilus junonius TaxID=109634 RepID=A0A9P5NTV4_GYMJU|nr:hypothetical protein CPB84DRAFT_1772955 [Gymnopilus junonius]
MRVFVALLVPAISFLNTGVRAATISNGLVSRQFHNADFNSCSESHGERAQSLSHRQELSDIQGLDASALLGSAAVGSSTNKKPSNDPSSGTTAARRQLRDATELPTNLTAQVAALAGATPAGTVTNSLSGAASRRQAPDLSGSVPTPVSSLRGSLPVGTVADSLSDAAIIPSPVPTEAPSLQSVDLDQATALVTSGSTATRDLKDVAEEDIAATDDIGKDLQDIHDLPDTPDLSEDREADVKERREANVTALQSTVPEQELVKSLTDTEA